MKKNVVYIALALLIGLFAGYLIFGNANNKEFPESHDHNEINTDQTWTCSMHPQIMQSEPGDCPICGMDLIPAEMGVDGLSPDQFIMTENAMALANIQTIVVGGGEIDSGILKLSGKIKENEESNAVQVAYFGGRIEKLFVNTTGQNVHKGQLIAAIYSPELVAAQQELLTALSLKKSQPELYNAVRNKLKLWKLSENQINRIEASGKVKENFPVYATVSGIVATKMVETGDYVKQGQPLYKIADLSSVWASFDAYENQISLVEKGQQIKITTKAYPDKDFEAKISFIDPVLDTKTRTFSVRATLKNKNSIFKPGMFVEGVVSVTNKKINTDITIPKSAILWTGERSVVYMKTQTDRPIFEMREVTLGNSNNDSYQILDGLVNGEEIVTNGAFTVDAAAQLQGKKSMMKRNLVIGQPQTTKNSEKIDVSNEFQKDFIKSLPAYFLLKDALVASNSRSASKFSEQMLNELKNVSTAGLQQRASEYMNSITKALEMIIAKKDLKDQRDHFVALNGDLETLVKSMDDFSHQIYIQECPMAGDNKGAVWLSKEEEIRNPYFGEQMLTCGSVIDTLKKK